MPFDLSTAKPVKGGGFDLSTAKPVHDQQPNAEEPERNWYDPVRAALQGVTLGFSDEIGAGIAAVPASLATGKPYKDVYRDMHSQLGEEREAYSEAHPVESAALNIGGGIATGGAGLARVGAKTAGMSLGKRIAANAGIGAAEGAIAGAGAAAPGERAAGAAIGAPLGAFGGAVVGGAQKNTALKREIGEMLKDGSTDRKTAKYMLNGFKRVKKDRVAMDAIKQGVDEGVVATIKGASNADKSAMGRMLTVMDRGRQNTKFGATNRATDVVGESLSKRIAKVAFENRKAGARLDGVAKSLKGNPARVDGAVDEFLADLDSIGVQVVRDADGVIKPVFGGADIEDIGPAEKLLRRLVYRMQKDEYDAYDVHRLKRYIDEQVSYGKQGEGLTGKTETIVKRLRRNLDQALDSQFSDYKLVNDVYADTRGALDSIQDAAGSKIDIQGANADKSLGTLSRSLLSNIRSRVGLINAIDDLDQTAMRYGGQFDDDILTQVLFADELDRLFGAAAKTSLQGDVQKAVARGVRSGAREAVIDTALDAANKARGINEENAVKALRKLLATTARKGGPEATAKGTASGTSVIVP